MTLTEEDKKFLIKIGQELPIKIKETKKKKKHPQKHRHYRKRNN
jgi:hypothetical protein